MNSHHKERLSHVGASGEARMVDVGGKEISRRRAVAEGRIATSAEALGQVLSNRAAKGDVLAVSRVAGIAAAKRTAEWIPLCHSLPVDALRVEILPVGPAAAALEAPALFMELPVDDWPGPGFRVRAEALTSARTGVEMEALTAVSATLLTLYDMLKAVDRGMQIEGIALLLKQGGRSGLWRRDD